MGKHDQLPCGAREAPLSRSPTGDRDVAGTPAAALGALLDPRFREHRGKFGPALQALNEFLDWFRLHYDTDLHSDTYSMLQDTMLLLQSCQALIELARDDPNEAPVPATLAAGPARREAAAPSPDPSQPCMVLLPNEY